MKKGFSLLLSAVMLLLSFQITIFAEETGNPSDAAENVTINAQPGKDSADITAYGDLEAVVIKASYNNGALENITTTDTIKLTNGVNTVTFAESVKEGDKIMVWNSIDGMKPYGAAYTVPAPETTPEPTQEPTPEPSPVPDTGGNLLTDGNIEILSSIPDGGWKPARGEWKKGLGTSAEIDTSNVSDNSTKSVKITNAALYQGVTLDGGENYSLSFDIYIGDGFNDSKLSWGIFGVADNGYIGNIGCGYKDGAAVSDSNFDANKKNEWQHIETEFLCPSDAAYVVEFLYGAPDSIYVDNVCISGGKPVPFTIERHDVSYTDKLGKNINIYGRLFIPNGNEKNGVIILSHGYNAYGDAFAEKCEFFARNGYAAYAFDFCGGSTKSKSTGRASTEMTLFTETEDLIAVFDYLSKLDCIDADNMFLSGDSQGGMVSALAAEELGDERVRAMALQFPAFGIPDVWRNEEANLPREHWGLMLGKVFATSVKNFYTFNYVGKNYTNNLLIISGTADPVVPISSVRQAVNSVYKNGKLVEFAGEGHGFSKTKEAEARQLILEFLNENTTDKSN